jgi:lambda family phage portal protein
VSLASRIGAAVKAFRSAYAAARTPPSGDSWVAQRGSARRATDGVTRKIADRARDAVRNNPYAARIVEVWVGQAVSDGITTRWDDEYHASAWTRWAASVEMDATRGGNWPSLQATAMRGTVESGEVLIRMLTVKPTPSNPVGLELLLMEGDALDDARFGDHNGNRIIQGVEIDQKGRPVAYWLRPDYEDYPASRIIVKSERVPASEMIHLFRRRRPGQVRDVSWLAPVLWPLRDLGRYEQALIQKAEIEACMAAIVNDETESTMTGDADAAGAHLVRDARGQVVESFEAGMILYRRGMGSVDVVNPTGGGSHLGFAKRTLEAASVGTGLTYDQVSGDLSGANYSSLRAGKIEFNRLLGQVQHTMLIPQLVDRVAQRFHELGVLRGLWRDDAGGRTHVPPAPEMIDPTKDTQALIAQVRAGFISQQEANGAFGYDFRQMVEMIRQANKALDEAGITLDTDPRRTARGGGAQDPAQNAAVELAAKAAA